MSPSSDHRAASHGVLLVNLGSPDSPAERDVRTYLDEFLMDPRVLDFPRPVRRLIVSGFILPKRPAESAEAYRAIWTENGSPLIVHSRGLCEALQNRLDLPVALAMRYGRPSIRAGLKKLLDGNGGGLREILLVPLFPHYAMSTFETVVEATRAALRDLKAKIALHVLPPFYRARAYVEALAARAQPSLEAGYDHALFSYHGLPERHLRKTDPTSRHCLRVEDCCSTPSPAHRTCYRHQVLETTSALVATCGVDADRYSIAFQSRLGRDTWLTPATEAELIRLGEAGIRNLVVMCPSFITDCLETIEEIGMRGRGTFLRAGGTTFTLIPSLNEHPRWVDALAGWCKQRSHDPVPV